MSRTIRILLGIAVLVIGAALVIQTRHPQMPPPLPLIGMSADPCGTFDAASPRARWRYDWAEKCAFRTANQAPQWAEGKPRVVMIGDSLTAFWNTLDPAIVRRGIAGQASDQVLLRFRQDVVALKPQVVHILVGTNDVAGNTGPSTPENVVGNIASMAEIARANGIVPVLGTLPPAHDFDWAPHVPPDPWVDRTNAAIRAYARREGLALADYHAVLADGEGRFDAALFEDGAHPNAAGYRKMAQVLDAAIAEALASE